MKNPNIIKKVNSLTSRLLGQPKPVILRILRAACACLLAWRYTH